MPIQTPLSLKTLHLVIHGRVQGVCYRQSMQSEAQQLAVSGWVKNRSNGTVEAVIHGESGALDALVRWARRGPPQAQVERVDVDQTDGKYTNFEII
jgi:acylphosphatase